MDRRVLVAAALVTAAAVGWAVLGATSCADAQDDDHTAPPAKLAAAVRLVEVADGFERPVDMVTAPGHPDLQFVVEQHVARIVVMRDFKMVGDPLLDLEGSKTVSRGNEQGLLGMVFHPDFAENRLFYVNYTARDGTSHVVEYRCADDDPTSLVPGSARTVLTVDQPWGNHNCGDLEFGPDGMLYIGWGDGGAAADPLNSGQNRKTMLGSMLRVDVDGRDEGKGYAVPGDNPFVDDPSALPEIWSYGLRNPWRYTFDRETGDLYIADVGQNKWEEVHVQPADSDGGENYGWNWMEGSHRFRRGGEPPGGLVPPAVEYHHRVGISITGGYVYRGQALPDLDGHYFYADFGSGVVRSFRWADGRAQDKWDWTEALGSKRPGQWSSFAEDADGELYLISLRGSIHRLAPAPAPDDSENPDDDDRRDY